MLSLGRGEGEAILITLPDGRTIGLKVARLNPTYARIAFDAPPDIGIWRGELYPDVTSTLFQPSMLEEPCTPTP